MELDKEALEWKPIETAPRDGTVIQIGYTKPDGEIYWDWGYWCSEQGTAPAFFGAYHSCQIVFGEVWRRFPRGIPLSRPQKRLIADEERRTSKTEFHLMLKKRKISPREWAEQQLAGNEVR